MTNPIKILHFIPLFDTGGTEKVVMDIFQGLDPSRFESHVCTFFPGEYDRFFAEKRQQRHVLVRDGSSPAHTPLGKAVNMIARLKHLRQVIRRTGVQLIHTHHLGPLLHVRLLHLRWPWVHTEHNVPDLAREYAHPVFQHLKPLRRPAVVTGVSSKVCRYLDGTCHVSAERIRLIPNGVDLDRFIPAPGRDAVRAELGLAPDDEVVGCIGNLRREKNQRLAIEAAALLHRQRPRLRLIMCGDGDRRTDLQQLAGARGISDHVLFLGYRFDVPRILAALDIFCLPSLYEGMPVSVLEAWAAGKPVVATDVIGIRDLIAHNINGMLVPPGQPQAMAEAIGGLLTDSVRMQHMAAAGRDLVTRQYSLKAMVAQYAAVYEQMVGQSVKIPRSN
jgi:glycosyltransferase involved in cell wall biosynthesis